MAGTPGAGQSNFPCCRGNRVACGRRSDDAEEWHKAELTSRAATAGAKPNRAESPLQNGRRDYAWPPQTWGPCTRPVLQDCQGRHGLHLRPVDLRHSSCATTALRNLQLARTSTPAGILGKCFSGVRYVQVAVRPVISSSSGQLTCWVTRLLLPPPSGPPTFAPIGCWSWSTM